MLANIISAGALTLLLTGGALADQPHKIYAGAQPHELFAKVGDGMKG